MLGVAGCMRLRLSFGKDGARGCCKEAGSEPCMLPPQQEGARRAVQARLAAIGAMHGHTMRNLVSSSGSQAQL